MKLTARSITSMIFLVIAPLLAACGACDPVYTEVPEEGTPRTQVVATFGEPNRSTQTDFGRIDLYDLHQQTCSGGVFPVPYIIILPVYYKQTAQWSFSYNPNDRFVKAQQWGDDLSNADIIIAATEQAALRRQCEDRIFEALSFENESLSELKSDCGTIVGPKTHWMLICLLGHQGDGQARYELGKGYHYGKATGVVDLPTALLWYELSRSMGHKEIQSKNCYSKVDVGWTCEETIPLVYPISEIRSRLTEESISKVEHRLTEWKPNLTECEIFSEVDIVPTRLD